jgi:hypothetical protein
MGGADRGAVGTNWATNERCCWCNSPAATRDDARLGFFLDQLPSLAAGRGRVPAPSWVHDDVFEFLTRHGAAYCVISGTGLPCVLRATAPSR